MPTAVPALDIDRRHRRALLVGAIVLALHLLLVALLSRPGPPRRSAADTAPRVALRIIVAPPVPPRPAAPPPVAAAAKPRRAAAPTVPGARPPSMATTPTTTPDSTAPTITSAAPVAPPASAPHDAAGSPSLLDSEATRRAIRASARAPSPSEQLARAREEPARIGAGERLGNDIRSAGKGDCVKGEYAGAGMGLLSLPFLAYAAAAGNCGK